MRETRKEWLLPLTAGLAAFGTYSCMYAFRKAFAAGTYSGITLWGMNFKVCLILAQVLGYMISKFWGIRVVSSLNPRYRPQAILGLIAMAWLALLGFALVPAPYNIIFLFINGLPLGMIWGVVFSFLEGRKSTELMAAIMASSLVFASGFVKSIGRLLMQQYHVSEYWMPFATGALFALPLVGFVVMLRKLPPPSAADIAARSVRQPMTSADRKAFAKNYLPALVFIVFTYLLLTIARDVRDNFEVEIWTKLGYGKQPAIFTQIDLPVAIAVLVILALLIKVKDNFKAFMLMHYLILAGCVLVGLSTLLFINGILSPVVWMSVAGFGLYIAYIPYNSIYFERMIASFRITGNVGFVMYIADASGYLGSVSVMFYKELASSQVSWLSFFTVCLLLVAALGSVSVACSIRYFRRKKESLPEKETLITNNFQPTIVNVI